MVRAYLAIAACTKWQVPLNPLYVITIEAKMELPQLPMSELSRDSLSLPESDDSTENVPGWLFMKC